jgi:WXXGXW repeat (2 copies)
MARKATFGSIGLAAALVLGLAGCNRAQYQGQDPASANMAPAVQTEPVARDLAPQNQGAVQNSGYEEQASWAPAPPPPLPEYSQPECPGENYMWTPGYWAYSADGYYWTPGAWIAAPYMGALWTPPWWGYSGARYIWHAGYWGPYVGFYGGINYGFGYTGRGFYGGYWQGGIFNYNRTVMNVNVTVVRNVYERRVANYTPVNRISYNGGNGGLNLRPAASEEIAMRAWRMGEAPAQAQYRREASANRAQFATVNGGHPGVPAANPVAPRPVATQNEGRTAEGKPVHQEAPAMNARPEARGGFEEPSMKRSAEAPAASVRPAPNQPPQPAPDPRQNPAANREGRHFGRQGSESGRPAVAARSSMPEQRPSPFRPPAARPSAPQPRQASSADRRMPEARPQPPAARPTQHAAPEAIPAAPQGRPGPAGHPEPQRKDDKRSK